ncbi:hypothetical protein V2H77_02370 [Photorhabdus sp. P32]|uniref:hypothetical protein n=1 Tax=Photorhabdus sp. P32 TaxID=3117549 RepID=UPI00311AF5E0
MQDATLAIHRDNELEMVYPNYTYHFVTTTLRIPIPVIFQGASLLAASTHPSHIASYAPGDSLPCRRDAS